MAESVKSTSSRPWTAFTSRSTASSSSQPQSSSASIISVRSLRKRSSFLFGRSRSDDTKTQQLTPLNPTTERDEGHQDPTPRPPTSHSTQTRRRNKAETLEAIRGSILGTRKTDSALASRATAVSNASLSSRRNGFISSTVPPQTGADFSNENDYYHHRRKQSISTPFNFEHVTHTAKTQLPALETVEEQDLTREFWSVSAHQRPKRHLNGIEAQDIPKRQIRTEFDEWNHPPFESRPVSPLTPAELGIETAHPLPTLDSPVAGLNDSTLDAKAATSPQSERDVNTTNDYNIIPHYPRRHSSLNALRPADGCPQIQSRLDTFYESDSSNPTIDAAPQANSHARQEGVCIPQSFSPASAPMSMPKQEDIELKARQPLPPLPDQSRQHIRNPSKCSLKMKVSKSTPSIALTIPADHSWSPISERSSKRSSRSSRFMRESPCLSSSTEMRYSTSMSDATWEDDVDFIYQQEAESTCDFNWEVPAGGVPDRFGSIDSPIASNDSPYHAHPPGAHSIKGRSTRMNLSSDTLAGRRHSRIREDPSRAMSVGHRGFLAARSSSQDLKKFQTPMQSSPSSDPPGILYPVSSVDVTDGTDGKTATTGGALHDSAVGCLNPDFLSDPESCRNSGSTEHRKSSSYGSHESSTRPLPNASRETARWSYASTSSLPDLMHSRSKNRMMISKMIVSAPLESLPQSPPYERDDEESTIVPREFQTQPVRNSFIMRRPQTSSDRALMHAAGRKTQRRGRRAPTPDGHIDVSERGVGIFSSSANSDGAGWI